MHEYTIHGFQKNKVVFLFSLVSVTITPLLAELLNPVFEKIGNLTKIPQITYYSITSITVFTVLWLLFTKIIWKIPFVGKILDIPNISGEWVCSGLGKKYSDIQTQNSWTGTISIEQCFETISIHLKTQDSQSRSLSVFGSIEREGCSEYAVTYFYRNTPFDKTQDLKQHTGFCRMIFNTKNNTAVGNYYTDNDRSSYGTMKLTKRENKND